MKRSSGQILPAVMTVLLVMLIAIAGLVEWLQQDSKWTVKNQKATSAVNVAEAALDRATWKLQSSTVTWATAAAGTAIAGYNFDSTYTDVPGGEYRIRFSSGPNAYQVTIMVEGRDAVQKQPRALQLVVQNQTIYSAMMTGGNVSWAQGLGIYWGPIIAQGNITLMDDNVARRYFPRKYAKGVVIGTAANPRDINSADPPNTDNTEWWSKYAGVPNVPILDFVSLRSSAAATGTLNVYGCVGSGVYTVNGTAVAGWDGRGSCSGSNSNHPLHFGNSTRFYAARGLDPTKDYVWYWDGDVSLEGDGYNGTLATSLKGTVIVRGTLTIDSSGDMVYTGNVPTEAWKEQQKLLINTYDTASAQEYPADTGYHSTSTTFRFGNDSWCEPGLGCGWVNTVGIKGFVYVGGNLNIYNYLDIQGAVWVNGSIESAYNNPSAFCGVFYDDTLQVPALNVILMRKSWKEVPLSSTPWS